MISENRRGQGTKKGQYVANGSAPHESGWNRVRWIAQEPDMSYPPFSARVGMDRDFCEMQARTNIACFAINELGRLTRHREWQTVETLTVANVAIHNAIEDDIAPQALTEHLAKMRLAYMHSLSVVSHGAAKQMTMASGRGWGSPFWLMASFFRELRRLARVPRANEAQAKKENLPGDVSTKEGSLCETDLSDQIDWISAST